MNAEYDIKVQNRKNTFEELSDLLKTEGLEDLYIHTIPRICGISINFKYLVITRFLVISNE